MKSYPILIVGCGPGSLDYLTPAALAAIEGAPVLLGARRLLDLFPAVQAERIAVGADIDAALETIAACRSKGPVAVLVTGDPGLCSLAAPVLDRFGREGCEVIPGVSSVQVAFARLKLDWQDARILDAHGSDPDVDPSSLADVKKIAVLAGRKGSLRWVSALLDALGPGRRVFVCEDLTLETESVREIDPGVLAGLTGSSRMIVLVLQEA